MSFTMNDSEEVKPRVITTEAGSRILAKREDPFGFWVAYFERGKSPADFDGYFTTFEHLVQAVHRYLNKQGKTKIKDISVNAQAAHELNDLPKQEKVA